MNQELLPGRPRDSHGDGYRLEQNLLSRMCVPGGMRRERLAREALRVRPLKQAGRADATCIKSVPMMLANTLPAAFGPG